MTWADTAVRHLLDTVSCPICGAEAIVDYLFSIFAPGKTTAGAGGGTRTTGPVKHRGGVIAQGASLSVNGATAANGKPSVTYSLLSGSLPSGISLNSSNGNLTGTVGGSGSYSFRIRATDALGRTADTSTISGNILSASVSPNPASAQVSQPGGPPTYVVGVDVTVTVTGGSGSYTIGWTRISGVGVIAIPGGSPSGRFCNFQAEVPANTIVSSTYRATITDGSAVFTVDVPVTLSYATGV